MEECWKARVEAALGRAEEYRLLGENVPEALKVHLDYIEDTVEVLISCLRRQATFDDQGGAELLEIVMQTLRNLRQELAVTEYGDGGSISRVRAELEKRTGSKLSAFGGRSSDLRAFRDAFVASVDAGSPPLSDIEKMVVLKSCLVGEAFDLVGALPTTARNYQAALKLLEDVYGSSQSEAIAELYHSLVELPQASINDGAKFRCTFWDLESILQAMAKEGVQVNSDHCIRILYLQKFSEKTTQTVLIEDSCMALPEIRNKMRRIVDIEELHSEPAHQQPEGYPAIPPLSNAPAASQTGVVRPDLSAAEAADEKPKASQAVAIIRVPAAKAVAKATQAKNAATFKPNQAAPVDKPPPAKNGVAGNPSSARITLAPAKFAVAGNHQANEETNASSTAACHAADDDGCRIAVQADDGSDAAGDEPNCAPTMITVCTTLMGTSAISVRVLLQSSPSISLLTESAAIRLKLDAGGPKTLKLVSAMGFHFTATEKTYKLFVRVNTYVLEPVNVHIADDSFGFSAEDVPAVDVADFKNEHPYLSHLEFPDPGKGQPVDLFLGSEYWDRYMNETRSSLPIVKKNWILEPSRFGPLVGHARVKYNRVVNCSYDLVGQQ